MATVAEAVRQPLLSAGKFAKNGWTRGKNANGNLHLKHGRDGYQIPIQYSGNSLAVKVEIWRVEQQYVREYRLVPKANKIIEDTWFYVNGIPTYMSEMDRQICDRHVDGRKQLESQTALAVRQCSWCPTRKRDNNISIQDGDHQMRNSGKSLCVRHNTVQKDPWWKRTLQYQIWRARR